MNQIVDASYRLGHFRDNADSLRRLQRQAAIALDLELNALAAAGLQTGMRVLDAGCGPGIISAAIARRFTPKRLVALDCNPVSLESAGRQMQDLPAAQCSVREGNVYALDDALDEQFDFIYARLVFQHLSEPSLALGNFAHRLAPGGRVCIADVDDAWFSTAPATPALASFLDRAARGQASRGGNRRVGSLLPHLLARAGFTEMKAEVLLISTDLIGADGFCDLTLGYKLEVIADAELGAAKREAAELRDLIGAVDGWGGIGVFFVSATTPQG